MEIVTLTGDQFIPGTTTFRHLEVTEMLEVSSVALEYLTSNDSLI